MAYDFYLDKCLLPVAPDELIISQKGLNTTVNLINEGEINLLKTPSLKEISFKFPIPQVSYPFSRYKEGFKEAGYYTDYMNRLNTAKKPFQFIVARQMPSGRSLFSTNIKVSMEALKITESAEDGFDLSIWVRLKEYRNYMFASLTVKDGTLTENTDRANSTVTDKPVTIGCDVIINGRLYGNSLGEAPGQMRTNYRGKINYIRPGASHPYHVTTPEGLWQGWVTAESVQVI